MHRYIKKLSIMTGLVFSGFSFVGCQDIKDDDVVENNSYVLEETLEEVEEGSLGLGEISQIADRKGEKFVGFLVNSYDAIGYPSSASIRYMPISSFSVLLSDTTFYVVKDYQNNQGSYYDYLRNQVVPENLASLEVIPLHAYISNHSSLFSDAVCDIYSHFTVFDSQKLLQENHATVSDLADYEQQKYLGISRVSSTEQNTCYIHYVPVDDLDIVYNSYQCYLVENYQENLSPSISQIDLLRGSKVPNYSDFSIISFSDFVFEHPDNFSSLIDEFLNNSDVDTFCISSQSFMDSYQSSVAKQKVR